MISTAAITIGLLSTQSGPTLLTRRASVGDSAAYALSITIEASPTLRITATMIDSVVSIRQGVILIERSTKDSTMDVNGTPTSVQDAGVSKLTYSTSGQFMGVIQARDKARTGRMAGALQCVVPNTAIKVGQQWEVKIPEDVSADIHPQLFKFKFDKLTQEGAYVSVTGGESGGKNPIKVEGTYVLSPGNGQIISANLVLQNAPFGTSPNGVTLKYALKAR